MDNGEWGYPEDFDGPSEPLQGRPPGPNEIVIFMKTRGFAGDRGTGSQLRKVVLAPGDALNVEWTAIGGPALS